MKTNKVAPEKAVTSDRPQSSSGIKEESLISASVCHLVEACIQRLVSSKMPSLELQGNSALVHTLLSTYSKLFLHTEAAETNGTKAESEIADKVTKH